MPEKSQAYVIGPKSLMSFIVSVLLMEACGAASPIALAARVSIDLLYIFLWNVGGDVGVDVVVGCNVLNEF